MGTLDLPEAQTREEALQLVASCGSTSAIGIPAIHNFLQDRCASQQTLLLRDHWRYWRDSGEAGHAGKLLTVDNRGHSVFIDDNIRGPDGHIVDIRDAISGESLPWPVAEARGHVEISWPYGALLDQQYFISIIDEALQRWQDRLLEHDGRSRL
eukprot:5159048-Amphidinium_carterae.1